MDNNIDAKIRFLEMIQGIISRMSANSFMLKGWSVTLVAGIFVLSDRETDGLFFLVALAPTILFWFLDSYYLKIERQYKHLYDIITDTHPDEINFKITRPKADKQRKTCYFQCFKSATEGFFYCPLILLICTIAAWGKIAC